MQTILGANGVIANNLGKGLLPYTNQIRLVSRNPKKINTSDQVVKADLLNQKETDKAVEGSSIVYLTVGLPYNINTWRTQWPLIMNNVIQASKRYRSKVVFFSNVYPYGSVDGWMTEETPINPCSKKGEVRAQIEDVLMNEVKQGNLEAMIVRAADFYGPHTPLSFVNIMLFEKYAKGKKGQWMISDEFKHSFTFTPDAGIAVAILGNTSSAYNQVWHAPTDANVLTGKQFMEIAAKEFGIELKYQVLPKWMIRLAGLFDRNVSEAVEMLYQNDRDYLFDSSKFQKAFNFEPTTYLSGIKQTVNSFT